LFWKACEIRHYETSSNWRILPYIFTNALNANVFQPYRIIALPLNTFISFQPKGSEDKVEWLSHEKIFFDWALILKVTPKYYLQAVDFTLHCRFLDMLLLLYERLKLYFLLFQHILGPVTHAAFSCIVIRGLLISAKHLSNFSYIIDIGLFNLSCQFYAHVTKNCPSAFCIIS